MEKIENPCADDFKLGTTVYTKRPFFDLYQGSVGTIVEDYGTGFMVKWNDRELSDGFNKEYELEFLGIIK